MDSNSYLVFLVVGTLLVLIDGQVIYRHGRRFLQQTTPNAPAKSLTTLVSVLFHLGTLGVLALLSTIDLPADNQTEAVVLRLGVVLIVLGIAHWIAVSALSRIRDREEFEEINSEREARRQANEAAIRVQGAQGLQGTNVPEPTVSPAYNGESATSVVNQQYPHR
jgi:hypothetical protein